MVRTPKRLDQNGLMAYAARALSARALTISELREKLKRRAAEATDVDEVLARLKESGYLNDQRFAESYASWRRDDGGLGKTRVLRDLLARRVAPEVARKAAEKAYQGADEIAMIEQFLARKYRGKDLAALLKEEKHLASAYRKLRTSGFSTSNSVRVLKRYAAQAELLEEADNEP
jgi:regulatory protein